MQESGNSAEWQKPIELRSLELVLPVLGAHLKAQREVLEEKIFEDMY